MQYIDEPMLEAFIYETSQIIEKLEQVVIISEKDNVFSDEDINEIFRFMHTIKGSSAMMMFNEMSSLAHKIEDIFFVIRENKLIDYDFSTLSDLVLESVDFLKVELLKIKNSETLDGDSERLTQAIEKYYHTLKIKNKIKTDKKIGKTKQKYYISPSGKKSEAEMYKATVYFKNHSEMENIRSYTIIHNIVELVDEIHYFPNDIIDNDNTVEQIRENGFKIIIKSKKESKEIKDFLNKTIFLKKLIFEKIETVEEYNLLVDQYSQDIPKEEVEIPETSTKYLVKTKQDLTTMTTQSIISVNVNKLDKLMDMVGELVIAEAMVSQNPEVKRLEIESFDKSSRQLHKITEELQDMVMAIRMVPLSTTFMKMHRIVRDMTKRLNKNVVLDVIGEETEADKNIIEKISDPLMHLIRNALDHGIEDESTRKSLGKNPQGTITLEAKNAGSDVLVIIRDDGKGLCKETIYNKAKEQDLVKLPLKDMTEKEIYNLILVPGFSTKVQVTEFSGRGVGMDVVAKNIENVGGNVVVDSKEGIGTTITLKIPLTLAIIEGMNIKVGNTRFTIPIMSIQESFRPEKNAVISDPEGNEMIMVRGLCYPILRLHELYDIKTQIESYDEGILIMVEEDGRSCCIFADELLGQQQVVVKALPQYIKRYKKIEGIGGCTLLGDGNISLILDIGALNLADVKNSKIN